MQVQRAFVHDVESQRMMMKVRQIANGASFHIAEHIGASCLVVPTLDGALVLLAVSG